MEDNIMFTAKDFQFNTIDRLTENYKTMRIFISRGYDIQVDNSKVNSHNINIDYPCFFCFAINKAEAVGLMMLSDWKYKHLEISKITIT